MTFRLRTPVARWTSAIVVASGPSLNPHVAEAVRLRQSPSCGVIAVKDAHMLVPFADVLYACDARWWTHHRGVPSFMGDKWSSHGPGANDKRLTAVRYDLSLIAGAERPGFSQERELIHYGYNSGFQAVNLALHMCTRPARITLVGFDMRVGADGRRHFFGNHPWETGQGFTRFIEAFDEAARRLPADVTIVNATPGSALTCFPLELS